MNTERKKRMITSIILIAAAIFCILINKFVFGIALAGICIKCFMEWRDINYRYFSKKFWNYFLIKCSGIFYLFIFYLAAVFLRGDSFQSSILFIIILCVCICSDIGGYVIGITIAGKKLTKISPNKTISGAIGSFIFSMFPVFLFNFQSYLETSLTFSNYNNEIIGHNFDFSLKNILFCVIISLTCQLGDLFISYFKRLNKIKNTGTILPGHGGLLDRIDGIIFAIPIVWFLKTSQVF